MFISYNFNPIPISLLARRGVLELPNLIYQARVSGMRFLSSNRRREVLYVFILSDCSQSITALDLMAAVCLGGGLLQGACLSLCPSPLSGGIHPKMYLSSRCLVDWLSALSVFSGPWEARASAAGPGLLPGDLGEVVCPLLLRASGTRSGKGGVRL